MTTWRRGRGYSKSPSAHAQIAHFIRCGLRRRHRYLKVSLPITKWANRALLRLRIDLYTHHRSGMMEGTTKKVFEPSEIDEAIRQEVETDVVPVFTDELKAASKYGFITVIERYNVGWHSGDYFVRRYLLGKEYKDRRFYVAFLSIEQRPAKRPPWTVNNVALCKSSNGQPRHFNTLAEAFEQCDADNKAA